VDTITGADDSNSVASDEGNSEFAMGTVSAEVSVESKGNVLEGTGVGATDSTVGVVAIVVGGGLGSLTTSLVWLVVVAAVTVAADWSARCSLDNGKSLSSLRGGLSP